MKSDNVIRLLVVGDIHGNIDMLSRIVLENESEPIDAIMLTGDIGISILTKDPYENQVRKRLYNNSVEAAFNALACLSAPMFFVPGNWDERNLKAPISLATNVDLFGAGGRASVGNLTIAGIGGSSFINGYFPYEWREDEIGNDIAKGLKSDNIAVGDSSVWIIHDPPYNCDLDVNLRGLHCGSKFVRSFIEAHRPMLCLSGHIHESAGIEVLCDGTLALNAGGISPLPETTLCLHLMKSD